MPEIRQYFAPTRRITPSDKGFEARQALARSQEALASSGERTAEAWTQAARRFGSLGTETADMLKQVGELKRQDIEDLKGLSLPAEGLRQGSPHVGSLRSEPDPLLSDVARADRINAAREVAQRAADLFASSYPTDPTTGQPFTRQSWALNQRQHELDSQQGRAGRPASGPAYPINPTTGQPYSAAQWDLNQRQYQQGQEQYRLGQEDQAQRRQQAAQQPTLTGPNGQPWTVSQADLWKRQNEIDDFNGRNPTLPSAQLPIDPSTGKNYTPNSWAAYRNANTYAGDQANNPNLTPVAPTAAAPAPLAPGDTAVTSFDGPAPAPAPDTDLDLWAGVGAGAVVASQGGSPSLWDTVKAQATPDQQAPATPDQQAPATPDQQAPATPDQQAPATPDQQAPSDSTGGVLQSISNFFSPTGGNP